MPTQKTSSKDVQIRKLVLLEYRSDHKPTQALKNIKFKIGECDLTLNMINFWFKRFDKGDTSLFKDKVEKKEMPKFVSTKRYLANDCHRFLTVDDPLLNNRLVITDGRIGFIVVFKKFRHARILMTDILHGDFKEVYKAGCLAGIKMDSRNSYSILAVDNERLLVYNDIKCRLYFLKFDADSGQFEVCSKSNVVGDFNFDKWPCLMLDELDKSKFVIYNWNGNFVIGSIVNDIICINRISLLPDFETPHFTRHVGNKLYVFGIGWPNQLWEYDLETSAGTLITDIRWELDTGKSFDLTYPTFTDHVWHNERMYFAVEYPVKLTKIVVLDLNTHLWSDTNIVVMGRSSGMFVDSDQVLMLKVCEDEVQGLNSFYRFPLKKPDSLMTLAWLTVLRQSSVFENELFDDFDDDDLPYICELRSLLPDD